MGRDLNAWLSRLVHGIEPGTETIEELLSLIHNSMAAGYYERCERILDHLHQRKPGSAELLWLHHMVCFERACHPGEQGIARHAGECMRYYREAVQIDPGKGLFPDHDYEIKGPLGFGGLSHVYLVEKDGRLFAAKSIRPELVANTTMTKRHEYQLPRVKAMTEAAQDAPGVGIAHITDYFVTANRVTIVYEYVQGRSLDYHLKRLPPEELKGERHFVRCMNLLRKVCAALQFAHSRGIAHLDVSPSNIMVAEPDSSWQEDSPIKIIDFDSARMVTGASGASLTSVLVAGTARYMDTNFLTDPTSLSAAGRSSDIFSVGMVAKAVLCGRPEEVKNPSGPSPRATPLLDEIIATATATEPTARFTGMAELGKSFEFAARIADRPVWADTRRRVKIGIAFVVAGYALSLVPTLPWHDWVTALRWLNPLLGILFVSPTIYLNVTYGLLAVGDILRNAWQDRYTKTVIGLWVMCAVRDAMLAGLLFCLVWRRTNRRRYPSFAVPERQAAASRGPELGVRSLRCLQLVRHGPCLRGRLHVRGPDKSRGRRLDVVIQRLRAPLLGRRHPLCHAGLANALGVPLEGGRLAERAWTEQHQGAGLVWGLRWACNRQGAPSLLVAIPAAAGLALPSPAPGKKSLKRIANVLPRLPSLDLPVP